MGASAADMAGEHGSGDYVVLHNVVQVRDPDDTATDPAEYVYAPANRGDTVTLDGAAAERLMGLGAIAEKDTDAAKFAEAGLRDPSTLGIPPSATMMSPQSERTGALRNVVQDRFGDPAMLMKLDIEQLQTVALAFGVPFKADDDKAALSEAILGGEEPEAGEGVAYVQHSDLSPAEQAEAAEEAGSASSGESKSSSSRRARAEEEEKGTSLVQATEAAAAFAESHGIDLADVTGSGEGGRVTQADVVRFHADRA